MPTANHPQKPSSKATTKAELVEALRSLERKLGTSRDVGVMRLDVDNILRWVKSTMNQLLDLASRLPDPAPASPCRVAHEATEADHASATCPECDAPRYAHVILRCTGCGIESDEETLERARVAALAEPAAHNWKCQPCGAVNSNPPHAPHRCWSCGAWKAAEPTAERISELHDSTISRALFGARAGDSHASYATRLELYVLRLADELRERGVTDDGIVRVATGTVEEWT